MTSLTIPPYNTDLDAWRERIEAKRAANHARWAAEQAAKESQRNPRRKQQVPMPRLKSKPVSYQTQLL